MLIATSDSGLGAPGARRTCLPCVPRKAGPGKSTRWPYDNERRCASTVAGVAPAGVRVAAVAAALEPRPPRRTSATSSLASSRGAGAGPRHAELWRRHCLLCRLCRLCRRSGARRARYPAHGRRSELAARWRWIAVLVLICQTRSGARAQPRWVPVSPGTRSRSTQSGCDARWVAPGGRPAVRPGGSPGCGAIGRAVLAARAAAGLSPDHLDVGPGSAAPGAGWTRARSRLTIDRDERVNRRTGSQCGARSRRLRRRLILV